MSDEELEQIRSRVSRQEDTEEDANRAYQDRYDLLEEVDRLRAMLVNFKPKEP